MLNRCFVNKPTAKMDKLAKVTLAFSPRLLSLLLFPYLKNSEELNRESL